MGFILDSKQLNQGVENADTEKWKWLFYLPNSQATNIIFLLLNYMSLRFYMYQLQANFAVTVISVILITLAAPGFILHKVLTNRETGNQQIY